MAGARTKARALPRVEAPSFMACQGRGLGSLRREAGMFCKDSSGRVAAAGASRGADGGKSCSRPRPAGRPGSRGARSPEPRPVGPPPASLPAESVRCKVSPPGFSPPRAEPRSRHLLAGPPSTPLQYQSPKPWALPLRCPETLHGSAVSLEAAWAPLPGEQSPSGPRTSVPKPSCHPRAPTASRSSAPVQPTWVLPSLLLPNPP